MDFSDEPCTSQGEEPILMDFSDGSSTSDDDKPLIMYFNDVSSRSNDEGKHKTCNEYDIRDPIVYTTKLDEMKIIKANTTEMRVETIIESIINESKPKLNLQRKRKSSGIHPHGSNEDLSSFINNLNRKVARIAENIKSQLSLCKPVKVVLVDFHQSFNHAILSTEKRINENVEKRCFEHRDKTLPTRLVSCKLKRRIIYDCQRKEADIYYLNKHNLIMEYRRFHNVVKEKASGSLENYAYNSDVYCCCWYDRDKCLKTLNLRPIETLRFIQKPHKCDFNQCCCCCRTNVSVSCDTSLISATSQNQLETPRIWFDKITEMYKSRSQQFIDISRRLIPKSLSVDPRVSKINDRVERDNIPFLHSTNIIFGEEYYEIGADGLIKKYFKNTGKNEHELSSCLMLKTANNIQCSICCWYNREKFAVRLLALGVLPVTVNFIRCAHSCPLTNCHCCCKPLKAKRTKLTTLLKGVRHTSNMAKKLNIQIKSLNMMGKPVAAAAPNYNNIKPVNIKTSTSDNSNIEPDFVETTTSCNNNIKSNIAGIKHYNKNKYVSFYFSLSALDVITKSKSDADNIEDVINSLIPENVTADNPKNIFDKRIVRITIDKSTPEYRTVIEGVSLNSLTIKELKMLNLIFNALNKITRDTRWELDRFRDILIKSNTVKRSPTNESSSVVHCVYPLLLHEQVSITTDLRNKRFLPSLKAHIEKYDLLFNKYFNDLSNEEIKLVNPN